jgi:hypothetical protein
MYNTDLDIDFLKNAQKITSFNIKASDFQSLTYKKELQYLFWFHFFPKFDLSRTINGIDINKLNNLITELKRHDSNMFAKLHAYNLKGIGPGETTIFFLVDNAILGGGSSAGADIIIDSKKFEVKAVTVTADGYASNFKLGGTVPIAGVITRLNLLREKLKLGGQASEINGSMINTMKSREPETFAAIEDEFQTIAYEHYFKQHDVIFINNGTGNKLGVIEAIKRVQKKDIKLERLTSGTIKPRVKL